MPARVPDRFNTLTPPPEPTDPPTVCLLQLAAGERTFVVDMLHVCRPKNAAAAPTAVEETSSGLTKREALLEEALGAVLGSPGVVKVGLGPKVGGIYQFATLLLFHARHVFAVDRCSCEKGKIQCLSCMFIFF